jgi:uncharacterized membrane protein
VNERLQLSLHRATYNLRGGFLVRPLIIAMALGFAGAGLSALEESFPFLQAWVPPILFPSHSDAQIAQVVLATIAGSMMTVVSIVFAVMLMAFTLASIQYSPRILVGFARDPVTQQTLGLFLGTFAFCVAALPAARSTPQQFAPVVTVLCAMLLAFACIVWLLYFIHHISQRISVNHIVDKIAAETEGIIDEFMPRPRRQRRALDTGLPEPTLWELTIPSELSGYVRFVDTDRLVDLAKAHGVTVRLLRRVGHFAPEGTPLLQVSRKDRIDPKAATDFRAAFDLGPTRTLQQDVEFGILQIVDIALKAISPAVNDPSTAISCVDHLSRILIRFASREPPPSLLYNPPGRLRVIVSWPDFERLLGTAFDQIRLYAQADVAVSLRMLRALTDIAITVPEEELREPLYPLGARIVAGCAERLGEGEVTELRARLAALGRVTGHGPDRKGDLGPGLLQQRAPQRQTGDQEIDDQPADIDQRGDEGRRRASRIEAQPAQEER